MQTILIIGIIAAVLLIPKTAYATKYDDLYKKYSDYAGVNWKLLKAISIVESSQKPTAINLNEGRGRSSYGMMQILYPDTLDFLNTLYGYDYKRNDLLDPEINVFLSSSLIKHLTKRYTLTSDIVASYNAGSVRRVNGRYVNQGYVDKVLKTLRSV